MGLSNHLVRMRVVVFVPLCWCVLALTRCSMDLENTQKNAIPTMTVGKLLTSQPDKKKCAFFSDPSRAALSPTLALAAAADTVSIIKSSLARSDVLNVLHNFPKLLRVSASCVFKMRQEFNDLGHFVARSMIILYSITLPSRNTTSSSCFSAIRTVRVTSPSNQLTHSLFFCCP